MELKEETLPSLLSTQHLPQLTCSTDFREQNKRQEPQLREEKAALSQLAQDYLDPSDTHPFAPVTK